MVVNPFNNIIFIQVKRDMDPPFFILLNFLCSYRDIDTTFLNI